MNNRIFITALKSAFASFCISSCASAWMCPSLITQNGFYVGADVGIADFMNKESHSVLPESHQLGSAGIVGGGLVGYDYGTPQLRIAIETFIDGTGTNTSIEHAGITYKMYQKYNWGIRFLPAYAFTPYTLGHLMIGYANGFFQIKDNGVYGFINTSYHRGGVQTGAGFTTTITSHFFTRLDAVYTLYSPKSSQGTGLSGEDGQSYSNKFSQLAGEFSLIYKFC